MRLTASTSVCLLIFLLCGTVVVTSAQTIDTSDDATNSTDMGGNNNGTVTREDVMQDIDTLIMCAMKTRTFSILLTNINEFIMPILVIFNIRNPLNDLATAILILLKIMRPLKILEMLLAQMHYFTI